MADEDQANQAFMTMMQAGSMFGPNKFSNYSGQRLSLPGYVGMPTDAMGNPIQPPPGMTLNQTPSAPTAAQPAQVAAPSGSKYGDWGALAPTVSQDPQIQANYAYDLGLGGQIDPTTHMVKMQNGATPTGGSAAGAAGAGGSGTPGILSRQQALSLLANPGKVTTPGATVPQAQPLGQPSVLDSFLASQKGGGQGAGGYSNQPFFDTLNKLRGGAAPQGA